MKAKHREPRFDLVLCGAEFEIRESDNPCEDLFGHIFAVFVGILLGWAVLPLLTFFPRFWCCKFTDNQMITLGLTTCIGFGLDYVLLSYGLGFLGPFFVVHKFF